MEIRHLRYFVAVAECGLVTKAAQQLHVSQPPLSRAIREFEDELGVDLFSRHKQRLTLTIVGEVLLEEAKTILSRVNGFKLRAEALSHGKHGRIRVGYVDGAMQGGILSAHLRGLSTRCPSVQVDLMPLSTEAQLRALSDGMIDVGIVYTPRSQDHEVATYKLLSDDMVLAYSVHDELAANPDIRPADLDGGAWIAVSREGDSSWRDRFASRCAEAGFHPDIRYEVTQLSAMLGLVETGVGRAFVQTSATRMQVPGVEFRPLPWWTDTVDYWLAWRKRHPVPVVEQLLIASGIQTA
ncbi:LysR family transcriptional regulator [Mesorhizobium sp. VK24D]|uniref:LysR family transcriptional regulator n=1 Tax=Mesorhizobium album TaxID=3072314 RepID=A0ABU4Y4S9_9HYPH|nr:LysR family transcriptional regulator [Mesorhizobium sp. VK24D]MDX8481313.1 LysR family transcriptional regulator [Mesorhizobium sp. VK24D]